MISPLYFTTYDSPLGEITLAATDEALSGLYFQGQKHWPTDSARWQRDDGARFDDARAWLDRFFSGNRNASLPKMAFARGTAFQQKVWRALLEIEPGQTWTYAQLASHIAASSAVRAVGAAVGRNPISVIVPCHRVVGSSGKLTGYAGGLDRKAWLLAHESAA